MDIYKKIGSRYKKIGVEWNGFPADGIWLVTNGMHSSSHMLKIGDFGGLSPIHELEYAVHREEVGMTLLDCQNRGLSAFDTAKEICSLFARIAEADNE